jgi:hypothetical protein
VLHSEILPEHDCGGELIELPEDEPMYGTVSRTYQRSMLAGSIGSSRVLGDARL